MKLEEICFEDDAFKAAVLATGFTEAEEVTEIRGRKQKIRSVKGLECFPNLKVLDLTRNRLSDIDLSGNPKLEQLFIGNNQLESIDLSGLEELEGLELFMNDIEELDLSHNKRLEVLYANANDFSEIDLSANTLLEEVQLDDNQLEKLVLPEPANFQKFTACNNSLSEELIMDLKKQLTGCPVKL